MYPNVNVLYNNVGYTTVEHDFCTTCYERPPVLRDRFCWAEAWVVAQDRFYWKWPSNEDKIFYVKKKRTEKLPLPTMINERDHWGASFPILIYGRI